MQQHVPPKTEYLLRLTQETRCNSRACRRILSRGIVGHLPSAAEGLLVPALGG